MKKVRDSASGAIGGAWIWKHPETGHVIRHSNFKGCRDQVKIFLRANNYPIGSNFDQEFEENLCANGAPNLCEELIPPTLLEKMTSLGRALYQAGKQWREPLVTPEVLEQRKAICAECNYFGGSSGLLRVACQKCGCSRLALHLASKICPLHPPKWGPQI